MSWSPQHWEELDGTPDKTAVLDRGNAATVSDPDGNPTTYGFASRSLAVGTGGLYCIYDNFGSEFNPAPKGGQVNGLMKRGPSGGLTGSAPMFFIAAQGPAIDDQAYLFGLSDSSPSYLILRKGKISEGLPNSPVGTDGVLARGSVAHGADEWKHLRLDMTRLPNGDILLAPRESDLAVQGMENPLWEEIPGMGQSVLDDVLAVATGTPPFTGGRMGFAFQFADVARRAFFTRIQCFQQV